MNEILKQVKEIVNLIEGNPVDTEAMDIQSCSISVELKEVDVYISVDRRDTKRNCDNTGMINPPPAGEG